MGSPYSGSQSSYVDLMLKGAMSPTLYNEIEANANSSGNLGKTGNLSDIYRRAAAPGTPSLPNAYVNPSNAGISGDMRSQNQYDRDLLSMILGQGKAQNQIAAEGGRQQNRLSLERSRGEASIAADLQRRLLQDKFSMLRQLLGGGNQYGNESVTTSGSTQETGGEYHNIGGRPEWMPTSRNIKSSETKTKRGVALEQLLSLLMG